MSIASSDSAPTASDGAGLLQTTVVLKVQLPHGHKPKMLKYQSSELVWTAKLQLIDLLPDLAASVKDIWNWGLQEDNCEPIRLKALPGMKSATVTKQFLDDGKSFADYGLAGEVSVQFCPRTRITQLTEKEASKINTKKAQKKFMEYLSSRNMEKLRESVEKGFDVNFYSEGDTNDTPLVTAVRNDDKNLIKLLIEDGGAHLDFRTPDGKTALHWAAQLNKFVALRSLLSYGAWHSAPEYPNLSTPVHIAASLGHNEILAHLLSCRASPNPVDRSGKFPLHVACAGSHVACVQTLLQYGADSNCINETRNTPLHVCAANNAIECAKELLKRGANKDQPNRAGQAPQQVAVLATNHDLADIIIKFSKDEAEPYPSPDPKMFADFERKQHATNVLAADSLPMSASNASGLIQPMAQLSLQRTVTAPPPPSHPPYDMSEPASTSISHQPSMSQQPSLSQHPSMSHFPSVSVHASLNRHGQYSDSHQPLPDPLTQLPPPPPVPLFHASSSSQSGSGQLDSTPLAPPQDQFALPPPPPLPDFSPTSTPSTTVSAHSGLPPPPPLPPAPAFLQSTSGLPPPPPLPLQTASPSPPNAYSTYRAESPPTNTVTPNVLPPPPPLPTLSTSPAQRHNSAPPPMSPSSPTGAAFNSVSPNYATVSGGTIGASAAAAAAAAGGAVPMSMPNLQRVMATFTPEQRKVFKTLLDENKRLQSELERVEAENQQLKRMIQGTGGGGGGNGLGAAQGAMYSSQPQLLQQPHQVASPPAPPFLVAGMQQQQQPPPPPPPQQMMMGSGMSMGMALSMGQGKGTGMIDTGLSGLPPPPPLPGQQQQQQHHLMHQNGGSPQFQSYMPPSPTGYQQQQPPQQQYGSQYNLQYQQPQYAQQQPQYMPPPQQQQQYGQVSQQQQQFYAPPPQHQQQQQQYGLPPPPPLPVGGYGGYSPQQGMGM